MNNGTRKETLLRFGIFELDLTTSELRKSGALLKLQSQQFHLLALLAGRPGQVVTRDEIRQALWDDQTFVDFDRSINFCVNQIRRALDDDPQSPRFVETLPRKGYRFIAPIENGDALVEAVPKIQSAPNSNPPRPRRWWLLAASSAVTLVVVALAMLRSGGTKPIQSLAVLPLENLSHDSEQDYFADGMTDELITDLAKISALRVISRTSVIRYKGTKKPVAQIARELNVDAVLEGTVLRDRDRVRITAQLIRADPERHLWADRYEGNLGNVLILQDTVAKAVAREIQVKLTTREQAILSARRSVEPEAYEAYLRGRHLWEISGEPGLQKSRDYFEEAINKDPSYARAWAGLADTYNYLASWGAMPSQVARSRARAAAQKALELDNSLVDPLITLAEVKMNYEWDWAGSERLCRQAINLNPHSGHAHGVYAIYLAELRRTEEAVGETRKAHEAEPLSDIYAVNLVWRLHVAHHDVEAEAEWHKQFGWDLRGDYILASVYLAEGRNEQALAELRKGVTLPWAGALEFMFLAHGLGVTGHRAEGQKVLQQMLDLTQHRYIPPEYIAIAYEGLGQRDLGIQWFEKAYAERSMNSWLMSDPRLDSIRTDARFKSILRRMGLPA